MKPSLPPFSSRSLRCRVAPLRGLLVSALLLTASAVPLASAQTKHRGSAPRHEVEVYASASPSNDNFANAQTLSGATGEVMGSNVGATKEAGEPDHADDYGGASVWYTYKSATTVLAVFTTEGSTFDTLLAAYTGSSVSALTEVASDDDYDYYDLASQITLVAKAGTTYHIAVDGFGGETGSIVLSYDSAAGTVPLISSAGTATGQVGTTFSYQIVATNAPTYYAASSLPEGLVINTATGLISGKPMYAGDYYVVIGATNANGSTTADLTVTIDEAYVLPAFFDGENALGNGVYYLSFPNGNYFGYYSFLTDPDYIYHFDLGYEYVFDAADGAGGVYLYDFTSNDFFYTSPYFPFPYLFDFNLYSTVYYYPDPNNPGHYNTNGVRYFYVFNTGRIISK